MRLPVIPAHQGAAVGQWSWMQLLVQFTQGTQYASDNDLPVGGVIAGFPAAAEYGWVDLTPDGLSTWQHWAGLGPRADALGQAMARAWLPFREWAIRKFAPGGGFDSAGNALPDIYYEDDYRLEWTADGGLRTFAVLPG